MPESSHILVVEDTKFFSNIICKAVAERVGGTAVPAMSLAETKAAVAASEKPFMLALVDLVLPDAENGEAVQWLLSQSIPCVVFTGIYSETMREQLFEQDIIDYVVKDSVASIDYMMDLVKRIERNRSTTVLVVDDSSTVRKYVGDLLRSYRFQVLEAVDGRDGLRVLRENPQVRLVITDYHMPQMDGVDMVREMRRSHGRDRLAIIGLSSGGDSALSAKFIKYGANDFINRPFLREEFFCRITQNMRVLDMVDTLTEMATKDALTGIHNRRFFFEAGHTLYASAARDRLTLTVAMVDVDFFKRVNDTYGHDAGDTVLKAVAAELRASCRQTDLVARLGGEEFAIAAVNMGQDDIEPFFNRLRQGLQDMVVEHDGVRIPITASFGVFSGLCDSLEEMLRQADIGLYAAKENGRNRVELVTAASTEPERVSELEVV
ncbi:diguanylate cyclase [Novispirillum itersonii]|uniref:diguanylate cyclase n=1 Tax=Novispirillum itersonii TaxID=189 RepID=A0A7X0DKZ8_NOVIT|nr:diguanylate cyclase [Novispirillum itersonii]MBB6209461.1 diguanylate cyclase (GGDEF)-like protein [Novispirillum itersonii]